MRTLAVLFVSLLALPALADTLPPSVAVPAKPNREVNVQSYGHAAFKTTGDDVVIAGRLYETELDTAAIPGDERKKWTALVDALKKAGWQMVYGDQQSNPPYASMKLVKAGKETWMFMWVGDATGITVVEKGEPTQKLTLAAPTDGIGKVAATADFPFLQHFPGAKLEGTEPDPRPLFVTLEAGKDPQLVANGTVVKHYTLPAGISGLDEAEVYRRALTAAGWTLVDVDENVTTGDPNLTAHYAKGTVDLWVHVHAGGTIQVGDAGADHASSKLKAELDRACKVAIYGVNFDFDKATLRPDAAPALDAIAKLLTDYKDLKVELGGHTDNVGERAYNQKLSEQRVAAVKVWLTKKGIADDRLTTKGYADTVPLVPNDSPQNQAKNRRVELVKQDCKK